MSQCSPFPGLDLELLASRAGEEWASARAADLRRQDRAVVGAWPGTLTEARAQVMAALSRGNPAHAGWDGTGEISVERLRALSQTAYRAARAAWRSVAEPDEENP